MKQRIPAGHQRADVEGEPHLCRRRDHFDGGLGHQVGIKRSEVVIGGFGKRGVRESRVQVMPIA